MIKKYGILAYPSKHSLSPVMHNAAFKALGMDAKYSAFEVAEKDLDVFFEIVKTEPIEGLSVSLPYKERVIPYLERLNEDAEKIGAVNTIINIDGHLGGFNTDFLASNKALFSDLSPRDHIPKKDPVAVVIGAGGAARAVCYGLLKMGVHVWVGNRTKSKADGIAMEFAEMFTDAEIHSVPLDDLGSGDFLINTTSIWMTNSQMGVAELPYFCKPEYVKHFKVVMDISYRPLETPLIQVARELGKHAITGDQMLLYQALDQFELFTGKKAPLGIMRKALREALVMP